MSQETCLPAYQLEGNCLSPSNDFWEIYTVPPPPSLEQGGGGGGGKGMNMNIY